MQRNTTQLLFPVQATVHHSCLAYASESVRNNSSKFSSKMQDRSSYEPIDPPANPVKGKTNSFLFLVYKLAFVRFSFCLYSVLTYSLLSDAQFFSRLSLTLSPRRLIDDTLPVCPAFPSAIQHPPFSLFTLSEMGIGRILFLQHWRSCLQSPKA